MKKIIILILLFASPLFAQMYTSTVDTTLFSIVTGEGGYYTSLMNREDYQDIPAGAGRFELQFNIASIDTSKWESVTGDQGYFRLVTNREEWYGLPAGTVRAELVSELSSVGTVTTSSGTATLNTTAGVITSDNASGSAACQVIIANSKVTATSVLIVSVVNAAETDTYCSIINLADGTFTVVARRASGDTFSGEIQITFLIIN